MTIPLDQRRTLHGDHQCQCMECGLAFTRVSAFDKHRYGPPRDRRCRTPAELEAKGWAVNARGFWRRPLRGSPGFAMLSGQKSDDRSQEVSTQPPPHESS